jgi:hypothetical protein
MHRNAVPLTCPLCGAASDRPVGFVRARLTFVCNQCRETVPIAARDRALADDQNWVDQVEGVADTAPATQMPS